MVTIRNPWIRVPIIGAVVFVFCLGALSLLFGIRQTIDQVWLNSQDVDSWIEFEDLQYVATGAGPGQRLIFGHDIHVKRDLHLERSYILQCQIEPGSALFGFRDATVVPHELELAGPHTNDGFSARLDHPTDGRLCVLDVRLEARVRDSTKTLSATSAPFAPGT